MNIRKAISADLSAVETIYSDVHTAEEQGIITVGWSRNVYPTVVTAQQALLRNDLFVQEDEGKIVGAAIINQKQPDVYKKAIWHYPAIDDEVMVLHTLVISPIVAGNGYGRKFVAFYEEYAAASACKYLRIDTNERNMNARTLYKKLGYTEIGIMPCVFNGLENVNLVLLEKNMRY